MEGSEDERPTLAEVEARYDFESFGPEDLAAMTPDEWEVAFDPDAWVTGLALLDRVETDLRRRIDDRDVFAVLDRIHSEGETCLLAYSDEGYALVRPTGEVEGFGTVLRDVKPSVALCSMPEYEPEPTNGPGELPDPVAVTEAHGELGNRMLQVIGFALGVSGLVMLLAWIAFGLPLLGMIVGIGFLIVAGFLLFVVANARLSARYRAEEYRARLRAAGVGSDERPEFLPKDEAKATADEA